MQIPMDGRLKRDERTPSKAYSQLFKCEELCLVRTFAVFWHVLGFVGHRDAAKLSKL